MNVLFNSKLLSVASLLLVAGLTVQMVQSMYGSAEHQQGYQIAPMPLCMDPCLESSYPFYECDHFNPLETAVCDPDACIFNAVTMAECQDGPPAEDEECCLDWDPAAIYAQQWAYAVAAPLTCVDNGAEPIPVPSGGCSFFPGGDGKCFIASCAGTLFATEPPRLGRWVCAECPDGGGKGGGGDLDPKIK